MRTRSARGQNAGAERGRTGARAVVEVKECCRGTSKERLWTGSRVISRPPELNNCLILSSQQRVLAREFCAGIVLVYIIVIYSSLCVRVYFIFSPLAVGFNHIQ